MSVVNEFTAKAIRKSPSDKKVYIKDGNGFNTVLPYDIECIIHAGTLPFNFSHNIYFFFSLKTNRCLITFYSSIPVMEMIHRCAVMIFTLKDDKPCLSTNWLYEQTKMMELITPDFKEQYASLLIDKVIND